MKDYQEIKETYFGNRKIRYDYKFRKSMKYEIYRYVLLLRKYERFCSMRDQSSNPIQKKYWVLCVKLCDRRKNILGMRLGIEITPNYVEKGIRICHQNVIINGYVGENCVFHGNNVIGNKRTGDSQAIPKLGKGVDVGIGAMVIGDVTIADNCVIGAGAVVTKSFLNPGTVIAGVPAKEIKPKKDN